MIRRPLVALLRVVRQVGAVGKEGGYGTDATESVPESRRDSHSQVGIRATKLQDM